MVGRLTFPRSEEKDVDTRERTIENEDSQQPPSYTDHTGVSPYVTETLTTTVTTTTQITQTTHFFSLPLWRRRAAPAMVSAMSEDPHASSINVEENGRIERSISYNTDKELPAVPRYDRVVRPAYTRRSASSQRELANKPNADDMAQGMGSFRASVSVPSQTRSARTLAQAGLGIGLPHVMPSATASTPRTSFSRSPRPSTAPRPSSHLEPSQKVRRVGSFSRAQNDGRFSGTKESDEKSRSREKSAALSIPKVNEAMDAIGPPAAKFEPRTVTKRASFWSRRRVQSLKDPSEAINVLAQNVQQPPVPALPTFQPVSPMFPDRDLQQSPGSTPQSPVFNSASRLRRRHSERSASVSSRRHLSPLEVTLTDALPVAPHRSSPGENKPLDNVTIASSRLVQNTTQRPIPMPFITTPSIARFPPTDERLSRPRSMTNPSNLLHRLSMNIFNPSTPSSPISSPTISTSISDRNTLSSSPRNSASLLRSSLSKSAVEIPKPKVEEESPDIFLGRLEEAVSKAEIANVLAGNGDPFYIQALQLFIDRFDFTNNPLDIALRKLLMDVGLPKETQQIDRVMEVFAANYSKCNPGLFVSDDHPYILAFSLIMLHTDFFNKSNKRKMTKTDYIKNTKLVGVSNEVLDYFFDNIVFAPFIFIEDPVDVNGQRGLTQDSKILSSVNGQATPTASGSGLSMLGKSNKIDPYYLITRNLLGPLQIDIENHIPLRNPFSYQGTAGSWNEGELRRSFARADVIDVDNLESRRMSTMPLFSMNVTGTPGPMLTSFASPVVSETESSPPEISSLRITKIGLLNRKEDLSDGGKRTSSRKWREWSVILTGSQLLMFRDSRVALDFISQGRSASENGKFSAQLSYLRPDELLSVKDAIAVYDSSYVKHDNVLRLAMPSRRQLLLQAESESQRNEWIAHINYASAFKTAGIRMRPVSVMEDARMDASSYTRDATKIPSNFEDRATDFVLEDESKEIFRSSKESSSVGGTSLRAQETFSNESSSRQSRSRVMLSKIQDFETKIKTTRSQIDSDIRTVRNLAILTPFQRSTRDRLQESVIGLGRHIRQSRLEVVKIACFRDVIAADLASEERERGRCRKDLVESKSRHLRRTDDSISRMTLSVHEDDLQHERSSRSLSRSELSHGHAESSICESFHSALDFGTNWPLISSTNPQRRTTQSFETSSPIISQTNETAAERLFIPNLSPFKIAHDSSSSTVVSADGDSPNIHQSGLVDVIQENTEEEAEEWNKTRAARRVSLVRVPYGLKVAARSDSRESTQTKKTSGFDDIMPSSRDSTRAVAF